MPLLNKPKIVKVPLTAKEKNIDHPKAFPKFRTLYLELLENKNKIKQDLINKDRSRIKSIKSQQFLENDENGI